jgi:hypothetical protein
MRVLEPGSEFDLALEALGTECGCELRMKNFEGNGAVMPKIAGEENGGHAATPKLALDAVAISQAALELLA